MSRVSGLALGISIFALAGCLAEAPIEESDPLAAYAECKLMRPDGARSACENEAIKVTPTLGPIPANWLCVATVGGFALHWDPLDDAHALAVTRETAANATGTVVIFEREDDRSIYVMEAPADKSWFRLDAPVPNAVSFSGLIFGDYVGDRPAALRNASIERLWSFVEGYTFDYPWLELRLTTPDGAAYVFPATAENPSVPGHWSPNTFQMDIGGEQFHYRFLYQQGGATGTPINPRQPIFPQPCTA